MQDDVSGFLRGSVQQGDERRLSQQLVLHWNTWRDDGMPFPSHAAFNPEDLGNLWNDCLLVQIKQEGKSFTHQYLHIGENIPGMLGDSETITSTLNLVDNLAGYYKDVVDDGKVAFRENEFTNSAGEPVKFRLILLPMGDNKRVDHILVGIRYRIYDAEE